MKVQRSSIYIRYQQGAYRQAIMEGFAWLTEMAKKDTSKSYALLAVVTQSNLRGYVSSVIGEKTVTSLAKGDDVTINGIVRLSLLTERKVMYSWNGPVLAIYPTKKLLDKIDSLSGATDVLVIPWTLQEVEYWIDTWTAIELGSAPQVEARIPFSNPLVEAALEALTNRVNLSTGILHPSDRAATIDLFRILRDSGISYDPDEIRAWLVRYGWKPRDADDVKKVSEAILARKALRGQRHAWSDNILDILRERAGQK